MAWFMCMLFLCASIIPNKLYSLLVKQTGGDLFFVILRTPLTTSLFSKQPLLRTLRLGEKGGCWLTMLMEFMGLIGLMKKQYGPYW